MSIAAAVKVAARALEKVDGTTVTIVRPSTDQTIEEVPCGLGSSPVMTVGADGAIVTIKSKDFLIRRELYDFGDGPVEPARGDQDHPDRRRRGSHLRAARLAREPSFRPADPGESAGGCTRRKSLSRCPHERPNR
jgi:hypothetical protein